MVISKNSTKVNDIFYHWVKNILSEITVFLKKKRHFVEK